MKTYKISIDKRLQKPFRKIPEKHARQILQALERLKDNPHPQDSKKLIMSAGFRVTVGEYRILYTIDEENAIVTVYLIIRRNDFKY